MFNMYIVENRKTIKDKIVLTLEGITSMVGIKKIYEIEEMNKEGYELVEEVIQKGSMFEKSSIRCKLIFRKRRNTL